MLGKWFCLRAPALYKHLFSDSRYWYSSSTIYALASGQSRSGVAIIRVSGLYATKSLLSLTKETSLDIFKQKQLYLRKLYDPYNNELIDESMVVWFKKPKSFTGEDVVEFHIHGSKAVASAMYRILDSFNNYRLAEPGEFSKRAYMNNRMDLTEVEGLIDLINAETEQQRKQSIYQMKGSLSELYKKWRTDLVKCTAHAEAYLDFHEDQNIEDNVLDEVNVKLKSLTENILTHLQDNRRGEILRSGCKIAIIGAPNAGKSSLLNILTQKPSAIVSPIAGTTRDIVESTINLGGYPVVLADTAGLRETNDVIETEGISRALDRANECDILLIVIDLTNSLMNNLYDYMKQHLSDLFSLTKNNASFESLSKIIIVNKTDLLTGLNIDNSQTILNSPVVAISCLTGHNVDLFLEILTQCVKEKCTEPSFSCPHLTNERHRNELKKTIHNLDMYFSMFEKDIVIAIEHLRLATRSLGKITGIVTTEEILDVIFRDFCIGK